MRGAAQKLTDEVFVNQHIGALQIAVKHRRFHEMQVVHACTPTEMPN
jgi:hypothetical protein